MDPQRFAVDKMLGRLAVWLRLVGQDATYGAHLSGRTLLRRARTQGRIILTRDRRLVRATSGIPLLFVTSDHVRLQLQQVLTAFQLDPFAHLFSRCSRCNAPLVPIDKSAVAQRVPPYVLATQDRFVTCPICKRLYWPATHLTHMRDELRRMGLGHDATVS